MDLQQVFGLYEPELKIVEDRLKDFFKSVASPIPLIGKHLIDSGGKRLRPLLLILSADISGFKGEARLRLAVMQKNQKIMETLSGATTRMTEGEILQLTKIGDPDITEEEYLNIISAKTGALISAACRIGAILGSLPEDKENALSHFGMKTGTAFQMADDILDYMADEGKLGKRLGKDLREGKITLPIIYLLKVATDKEVREGKK